MDKKKVMISFVSLLFFSQCYSHNISIIDNNIYTEDIFSTMASLKKRYNSQYDHYKRLYSLFPLTYYKSQMNCYYDRLKEVSINILSFFTMCNNNRTIIFNSLNDIPRFLSYETSNSFAGMVTITIEGNNYECVGYYSGRGIIRKYVIVLCPYCSQLILFAVFRIDPPFQITQEAYCIESWPEIDSLKDSICVLNPANHSLIH